MDESIIGSLDETIEIIIGDESINSSLNDGILESEVGDDFVEAETYEIIEEQLDTTGLAREDKQLPDGHNVNVANQIDISNIARDSTVEGVKTAIEELPILPNNHNVTVSNIASTPIPDVSDLAKADNQLPDNHNVTVSNQISGFGSENTLKKLVGFAPGEYDTVDLQFTDSTKLTLSAIIYKKDGLTVATITVTSPDTVTTRFIKS